jgi:hypothetical protein
VHTYTYKLSYKIATNLTNWNSYGRVSGADSSLEEGNMSIHTRNISIYVLTLLALFCQRVYPIVTTSRGVVGILTRVWCFLYYPRQNVQNVQNVVVAA